eukprot:CAMPEP_0168172536 /NCGR_PEP_ID=MMETSP0139_2-20121125/5324_1 /TAXON_ID=44445 /ORGANISM="Pseudo-nitzschia australis, Strain 10249 10 AB" /LENGTH=140 /DNA_ID=CAMNT_0008090229 /DNA_START=295 /DNA_END=718 /DNA_ORIENTATION=-
MWVLEIKQHQRYNRIKWNFGMDNDIDDARGGGDDSGGGNAVGGGGCCCYNGNHAVLTTLHGNVHTNNSTNFHAIASTMGERDNGNCGAGMCPVDHKTQSLWGLLGGSASGNDHRKRFRTNGSINSNANVHVHAVVSTGVH